VPAVERPAMEVNCEGCAGCCVDWRALADADHDHERRGPHDPVDDVYNLVPLTRDEVRAFVDAGYADALTPRCWTVADPDASTVAVDGYDLAAVAGKPAFYVGLRKVPKPVGPFETDERWLPTCAFLDPTTLQCRIHGDDLYPGECGAYPGHNLALDVETECERVEREVGGERLVDDAAPADLDGLVLGPGAVGATVFVHPDPDALSGTIERVAARELTPEDRAEFVATAAAAAPGTVARNEARYERAYEAALAADSWVGRAAEAWAARAGDVGETAPDPTLAGSIEEARGAPETPGWDAVE